MKHEAPPEAGGYFRLDPTRRPVPAGVPDEFLSRWQADRDAAEAAYAASLAACRSELSALRGLIGDGSGIAGELRTLMRLFTLAIDDAGFDRMGMADAANLVVSCAGTMADRLDALATQAHALRQDRSAAL